VLNADKTDLQDHWIAMLQDLIENPKTKQISKKYFKSSNTKIMLY
jgi:hypothetical protein